METYWRNNSEIKICEANLKFYYYASECLNMINMCNSDFKWISEAAEDEEDEQILVDFSIGQFTTISDSYMLLIPL